MKSLHSSFFCVPSSFGQSAKKFRWMLNGIRPFSFIRLITWKYIRLSFALLCFFFDIFWVWMQKMRLLHLPLGPVCVRFKCEHLLLLVVPISRISLRIKQPMSTLFHMLTDRVILVLFFLIRHNWYACHNFHFTPSTGTAYIWISWLQTFSMPFNFLFVFFSSSNLIRITASLLQFEFRI